MRLKNRPKDESEGFDPASFALDLPEVPKTFDATPDEAEGKDPVIRADSATGLDGAIPQFRRRTEARAFKDLSQIRNAAKKIGTLPGEEETLHCIAGGDHTGWDMVPAIHELLGRPIDELIISTLGFSTYNIASLCEMVDAGEVKSVSILAGDFFAKGSAQFYQFAVAEFKKRGLQIRAMRNHTKIVLISSGPLFYTVETSANLRSCNNLEQFTLTRSRPLYDFHRTWIKRVLEFGA